MMAAGRALATVAVVAMLAASATVAQVKPADNAALDLARKAGREGRYLEAAEMLRPLALTPEGRIRDEAAWSQWSEIEGVLTGEPPARPAGDRSTSDPKAAAAAIERIAHADTRDAVTEIVAGAKKTRIVILNEAHTVPRSRAFAIEVARALRPLGYDVLAAETFSNTAEPDRYAAQMAGLAKDGYARRFTGYYTRDPVFASFVREALALGYRPVAYETTVHEPPKDVVAGIVRREQAQTDYLMTRAVTAYPKSKILIYVGHSHVTEAPISRGNEKISWMATRLKAASGIDPLTIDQTEFLFPSPDGGDSDTAAIARAKRRSIVLVDRAGPVRIGQYADAVDLQVIHPRLAPVDGRPGWLAALGRKPTAIPAALLPASGRRLIQAFPAGTGDDAIPIDQVVVTAGQSPPKLLLDGRPFVLRSQDAVAPVQ